jgi:ubiquinone/menaquinone biosynthesis C-methylase UbiE
MEEKIAKTIKTYEETAEEFSRIHGDIEKYTKIPADFFMKKVKGKRILDVGCGPGRDSKYFSDKGFDVTGIDLTKNFIKIASKNAPKAKFMLMDMRKLEFPDNSFDGLWACASLLHIPKEDAESTLKEFRRVLVPKGLIFISVKKGSGEKMMFRKEEYKGGEKFFAFYSEDELKRVVEMCGFKVLSIRAQEKGETTWISLFAFKN